MFAERENILTPKQKNLIKFAAIILFIVIGIFEGAFFYVKSMVRPETYEQQIVSAIKEQTGQDVKINGGVSFKLFPTPKMVFSDLSVDSNVDGISYAPNFTIEKVEVYFKAMSLLTSQVKLSGIKFVHPVLSIERAGDNTIHWQWLNLKLLKSLNTKEGKGVSLPLFISGGEFKYKDEVNNKSFVAENINATTQYDSQLSLVGSLYSSGNNFGFSIDSKTTDLPVKDSEFPLNIRINDDYQNTLTINSVVDSSGDFPKIIGNFNMKAVDIEKMVQSNLARAVDSNDNAPMELAIAGAWNLDDDSLQMKGVTIKGMNSDGKGTGSVRWNNWYPTVSANIDFSNIDAQMLKRLAESRTVKIPRKPDEVDESQSFDYYKENPLPENVEIKLDINAQKVLWGKEEWKNIRLNAVLDKGAFTVNQCDIHLSEDGLLSVFGVISQGGNGDLRFEGNMEAKGQSLHDAILMFYPSGKDLPDIGSGEFSISSNLYINSNQIRLFEANAKISGTPISGTITAYLDPQLRIDTKIKLNDINFDSIRDKFRKESIEDAKNQKETPGAPSVAKPMGFDWLRNLSTRLDVKVYVDNFTFMERKGDRVSFTLYAYGGDLRISNMQFTYPDGVSELNCNVDVRGAIPNVNLMVNADQVDTRYFSMLAQREENFPPKPAETKAGKKKLTPKENIEIEKLATDTPVPLGWMDNFNGSFDITLRKFIHKNILLDKIKLQARLDNKKLTIQKLGFIYSQAQTNIIGTIFGGKVPGMTINFTMANADIYEIFSPLININNINGFTSMSGVVSTNGWSLHEWLEQMDANLLVSARGVKVEGININGVSNVIDVARSSADVFNNVNNVLTKGSTEFSVDGSLNIHDGELRAPKLTLRTGLVTGYIIGGVKLESMIGQFSIGFNFANLLSDSIPTMIIQLSGKMDKPDIRVDTASLEDFVARRNVGK